MWIDCILFVCFFALGILQKTDHKNNNERIKNRHNTKKNCLPAAIKHKLTPLQSVEWMMMWTRIYKKWTKCFVCFYNVVIKKQKNLHRKSSMRSQFDVNETNQWNVWLLAATKLNAVNRFFVVVFIIKFFFYLLFRWLPTNVKSFQSKFQFIHSFTSRPNETRSRQW